MIEFHNNDDDYFVIAWWNTALSPNAKKDKFEDKDIRYVEQVLIDMASVGVSFIALGEVSSCVYDVLLKSDNIFSQNYDIFDQTISSGRSSFDTLIACRKDKIRLVGKKDLIWVTNHHNLRVAQRYMINLNDDDYFYIYVSHWPSRIISEAEVDRNSVAMQLRNNIDYVLDGDEVAQIITMGDYNDEPFNDSISKYLKSTRDKALLESRRHLLYNPFWSHLGYLPQSKEDNNLPLGTYFHAANSTSRWRVFDQILFSSSLVNGSAGWKVNERLTKVYDINKCLAEVLDDGSKFDHMPVLAVLHKE